MYRTYIAESVRLRGEGKYIGTSYVDMVRPRSSVVIDTDGIIDRVASALEEE